jgi:membrane protein required for beta-lactamase induction
MSDVRKQEVDRLYSAYKEASKKSDKASEAWLDAHEAWVASMTDDEKIIELDQQLKECSSVSSW